MAFKFNFNSIDFKDKKVQNYLVIAIAILSVIGTGTYLYYNLFGDSDKKEERNDKEILINGEANRLNLSVPDANNPLNDSKQMQYDQFTQDSLAAIKAKETYNATVGNIDNLSTNNQTVSSPSISDADFEQMRRNARSSTGNSNAHSTYGTSSMWQSQQPDVNVGYSDMGNVVTKRPGKKNQNNTSVQDYDNLPTYSPSSNNNTTIAQSPQPQVQSYDEEKSFSNGKQIKARLITKGKVMNGSRLAFVILQPTTISGIQVQKSQVVFGTARVSEDRLIVNFNAINIGNKTVPVAMKQFGEDGLEGLPISSGGNSNQLKDGARTAAGQIVDNVVSSVPIIGGALSSATRRNGGNQQNSINIIDNISVILVTYK